MLCYFLMMLTILAILASAEPSALSCCNNHFNSDQTTLWQGNTVLVDSNTPSTLFNFTYPYTYNSTYSRAIVMSGYKFHVDLQFDLKVDMATTSPTTDTIMLNIYRDTQVYFVSIGILVISMQQQWLWAQTQFVQPVDLTVTGTGIYDENFPSIPLKYTLTNPADYKVIALVKDFNTTADPARAPQANLEVISKNTTHLDIKVNRKNDYKKLYNVSFVLIAYNMTYISLSSDIMLDQYSYSFDYYYPFHPTSYDDRPKNFGIDEKYRYGIGFDVNCLTGMDIMSMDSRQTTQDYIVMDTYPIDATLELFRDNLAFYYIMANHIFLCVFQYHYGQQCADIYDLDPFCAKCQRGLCLECQNNLKFAPQDLKSCVCTFGELINGTCVIVPGCVQTYVTSNGEEICQNCNTDYFHLTPVNGECICITGTLVNGICNTVQGCAVPQINSYGVVVCISCNVSAGFDNAPDSSGQCLCKQYYELNGKICQQICGNGIIFSTQAGVCDDGNKIDGDGCSSTCLVEPFYTCNNNVSPSFCSYRGSPLNLSLSSIRKNGDNNQGTFVFDLKPELRFLRDIENTATIVLDCPSNYTINQTTYDQAKLALIVDYTDDMEGISCQLTISYNPNVTTLANNTLNFSVISNNQKLIIIDQSSRATKQKITFIFKILGYVSLGVFFISLRHKMIGLELITMCQVIYFSYAFYVTQTYFSSSITSLKMATGYRTIFYNQLTDGQLFYPFSEITQMSRQVLQNSIVWLAALCLITLLTGIILLYQYCKQKDTYRSQQKELIFYCIQINSFQYMYNCFLFPVVIFNLIINTVTVNLNSIRLTADHDTFSNGVNSFGLLGTWLVSALVVSIELIFKGPKGKGKGICGTQQMTDIYIPLFLFKLLTFSFLIVLGLWLTFDLIIYIMASLFFISMVTLLFLRPYTSILSNLTIIISESVSFYSLVLASIKDKIEMSEHAEIFMLLILEGLIIVCIVLFAIRTARYYCYLCSVEFDESQLVVRQSQEGQKTPVQNSRYNEGLKSSANSSQFRRQNTRKISEDDEIADHLTKYLRKAYSGHMTNNHSVFQVTEEQKQLEDMNEDEGQLRQIKDRLREDLIKKRQKNELDKARNQL